MWNRRPKTETDMELCGHKMGANLYTSVYDYQSYREVYKFASHWLSGTLNLKIMHINISIRYWEVYFFSCTRQTWERSCFGFALGDQNGFWQKNLKVCHAELGGVYYSWVSGKEFGVRIGWRKYLYECTPFGYVTFITSGFVPISYEWYQMR